MEIVNYDSGWVDVVRYKSEQNVKQEESVH